LGGPERAVSAGRARIEALRIGIATGFGLGRVPFAPGTVGSIPGLFLAYGAWRLGGAWAVLATALAVTALGLWTASSAASRARRPDPPEVVIDEVAGQVVALLALAPSPRAMCIAFVLFRAFDVLKPFPISRLESLRGASGIMADDLAAGVAANLAQRLLLWVLPGSWGAA
jgi:phosphatidylglycerophosphatase A